MNRKRVESVIEDLARKWDLPEIALDEDYLCIESRPDFIVNLDYFENDNAISCYATVGEVPAEGKNELYRSLLGGNYDWVETAGTTVSVDPAGQFVLVTASMSATDLDLEKLLDSFDRLYQAAQKWQPVIDLFDSEEEDASGPNSNGHLSPFSSSSGIQEVPDLPSEMGIDPSRFA